MSTKYDFIFSLIVYTRSQWWLGRYLLPPSRTHSSVDKTETSLESLLSMKVAPLLLHNMLLLSALLPYAVKASVFLHDLHSSIVYLNAP